MIDIALLFFGVATVGCSVGVCAVGLNALFDGHARRRLAKQERQGKAIAPARRSPPLPLPPKAYNGPWQSVEPILLVAAHPEEWAGSLPVAEVTDDDTIPLRLDVVT